MLDVAINLLENQVGFYLFPVMALKAFCNCQFESTLLIHACFA